MIPRSGAAVSCRHVAGTRDTFRRLLARAGDAVAAEGGASKPHSNQIVMIVDDAPLLVELTQEMIVELGYATLTFDSGGHARARPSTTPA